MTQNQRASKIFLLDVKLKVKCKESDDGDFSVDTGDSEDRYYSSDDSSDDSYS